MHRIRLAILLFLCVSAAGCQPVPGVLLDAEAIVMEHPDSAARLLEGVPAPEKRLSRRNYAHYALVLTQARWLAGENMIDDTSYKPGSILQSYDVREELGCHK